MLWVDSSDPHVLSVPFLPWKRLQVALMLHRGSMPHPAQCHREAYCRAGLEHKASSSVLWSRLPTRDEGTEAQRLMKIVLSPSWAQVDSAQGSQQSGLLPGPGKGQHWAGPTWRGLVTPRSRGRVAATKGLGLCLRKLPFPSLEWEGGSQRRPQHELCQGA